MSNYFKLMSIGILSVSTLPSLSLKYIVPIILPLFILTSGLSFNCKSLNSIPTLIVFSSSDFKSNLFLILSPFSTPDFCGETSTPTPPPVERDPPPSIIPIPILALLFDYCQ